MSKVVVIGLDGASPELVFDKWLDELPNIKSIVESGCYGRLKSTVPAITPPAWTAMLTGQNPGKFGFWSFTFRDNFSYQEKQLINSNKIKSEAIYHALSRQGKKAALINVPVTYPAVVLPGGMCVSSFLAPDTDCDFVYPGELKQELTRRYGQYIFDASEEGYNFRQLSPDRVKKRIYEMDSQKFAITLDAVKSRKYDLVFTVLMGTDRMAHLFFKYAQENHPYYENDPAYKNVLLDHYRFCDSWIGEILKSLDKDTTLLLVSDHGTQGLKGRFNSNEWLIQNGYLKLKDKPPEPTALSKLRVDWDNTVAWTTGFTEARLYLNIKGREKQGVIEPGDYDKTLDRIAGELKDLKDKSGEQIPVKPIKRKDIYSGPYAKYAPDLFLEMDKNQWANNALVGYGSLYSYHTPKGNDYGVHSPHGIFAARSAGKQTQKNRELKNINNCDIGPTILDLLNVPLSDDMDGHPIKL